MRPLRYFTRLLAGSGALLITWAPVILLAVLAGAYFVSIYNFLLSPGQAVLLQYEGKDGIYSVRAESYMIDPETRIARITGVTMTDPAGLTLLDADAATVEMKGGSFLVHANTAEALLVRREDGSFAFEDAVPAPKGDKPPQPLLIELDKATVRYIDMYGEYEVQDEAILTGVTFSQGREGVTAQALLNLTDEPPIPLQVQLAEDGKGWVRGVFENFDLAKKRPLIERWVDMSQFQEAARARFGSLNIDGSFEADWVPDEAPVIRAAGNLSATQANYPGWVNGARVNTQVSYIGDKLTLKGDLTEPGRSVAFDGSVLIQEKPEIFGSVVARVDSNRALWPEIQKMVPEGIQFQQARYDGWLNWRGGTDFDTAGDVTAANVTYAEDRVTAINAALQVDAESVNLRLQNAEWNGFEITGAAELGLQGEMPINGFVRTNRGRLEPIAARFDTDRFRGIGSVEAILGGTVEEPYAEVSARGSGSARLTDAAPDLYVRTFEVRGMVSMQGASLDRVYLDSPHGSVSAKGTVMWDTGELDLTADAAGVNLQAFFPDVEGAGYANAVITGTLEDPSAQVNAEAFGIKAGGQELPHVILQGGLDDGIAHVDSLTAMSGSGRIEGSGQLVLETGALSGEFSGSRIQVATYTNDVLAGWIAVEDGEISGTLEDPRVVARVTSDGLVASGTNIDSVNAVVVADKNSVSSGEFLATIGEGRIEGDTLNYSFSEQIGRISGQIIDAPLARLPGRPDLAAISGTASGDFTGTFGIDQPLMLSTDLDLSDIAVNKTPLGSGYATIGYEGDVLTATGELGSIERYLRLDSLTMNTTDNTIDAGAEVFNFALEDVITAADPVIEEQPPTVRDLAVDAKGLISGLITVSGPQNDPNIAVSSFAVTALQLEGLGFGEIHVEASRDAGQWNLANLTWQGPDEIASFTTNGQFTEDGELMLREAYLSYFNLEWITVFAPDAPRIVGNLSLQLPNGITGTMENPVVTGGSLLVSGESFAQTGGESTSLGLNAFLSDISVQDRVLNADGQLTFKGLTGVLTANVPFSAFEGEGTPDRQPLDARFVVDERPLEQLAEQLDLGSIEAENDAISAELSLTGVTGDLHLNGVVTGRADRMVVEGLDTVLEDVSLTVNYLDGDISVEAGVTSGDGGSIAVTASAVTPNLLAPEVDLSDVLAQSPIEGRVDLNELRINQRLSFRGPTGEVFEADRESEGLVDGEILIGGSLAQPRISSRDLVAQNVTLALPAELPAGRESAPPPINPIFDIDVNVPASSRVMFGLGEIELSGLAEVNGSLTDLVIEAPMTVEGGVLRLPTARVAIEQGGRVAVRSAEGNTRIDLSIEGTTRITARRASDLYESYDVRLYVRGDLLDEEGLQFDAVSEPAELTRDEILAVLGQKQLIEGLTLNSLQGGSRDELLRETLFTFALPTLAAGFTDTLATNLSLDYIALEYNPFDQAVVRAGKELTDGLMLHFLRQLSEPEIGPQKWEVKLTYRPPLKDKFFSRTRLSVGADQDVPWKIRFDWSRRF